MQCTEYISPNMALDAYIPENLSVSGICRTSMMEIFFFNENQMYLFEITRLKNVITECGKFLHCIHQVWKFL